MGRDYISDRLIHWTGRNKTDKEAFEILKTVCEEGILRLSYCPNYSEIAEGQQSAMVCFTDIPLRFSQEHCGKFGRFGIAFNKQRMIHYGANPVFYTTSKHFQRIREVTSLLARMLDLEKDREWRDCELEPYQFTEDQFSAFKEVSEFLQEYSYRNKDDSEYVTYYQREWRLTFNSLPFAGGSKPHDPGMSCFYIRDEKPYQIFKFHKDDIGLRGHNT